ncbi:MBOAT family O-acyltransferase [Fulvivirga marina]|uniref:MBOAT family O-acyltransferase n=1 Tax=Fulvivirga marina TaxID=2494733 RepID=UPI001EE353D7
MSTLVDYHIARQIFSEAKKTTKQILLGISLSVNLGVLIAFKYYNFFSHNINEVLSTVNVLGRLPYYDLLLPVGISFYTFQTLSYTIDVYHGRIQPQNHFGKFAVFVSFFPQLVAGPIERASHLIPQLDKKVEFSYRNAVSGLRRILWGMFKKVVVADRLAIIVDHVYGSHEEQTGFSLLIASYLFAFQIYCDFSGYSDIAIGSARLLGIDLMENFRRPYFSRSISEFWSRWHISLSTWFRDYVYIPLGGNRVSMRRVYINILIVFLVSGLWHGANWTFVVWGALHGVYLIFERVLKNKVRFNNSLFVQSVQILICFHLVVFGWIFFRSESVEQSISIIASIFDVEQWRVSFSYFEQLKIHKPVVTIPKFLTTLCMLTLLIIGDMILSYLKLKKAFFALSRPYRWGVYIIVILLIVLVGNHGESEFIYFQF